jgi:hypothetical protein
MKASNVRIGQGQPAELPPGVRPLFGADDDNSVPLEVAAASAPRARVAELPSRVTMPNGSTAEFVIDARGRRLQLRTLSIVEEQDALVAMGVHADSGIARARALLAMQIASIDDMGMPIPKNDRQYRAMLQQVGHEGVDAVFSHRRPAPTGEPLMVLDGAPGDYILAPVDGGVGLFPAEAVNDNGDKLAKN